MGHQSVIIIMERRCRRFKKNKKKTHMLMAYLTLLSSWKHHTAKRDFQMLVQGLHCRGMANCSKSNGVRTYFIVITVCGWAL